MLMYGTISSVGIFCQASFYRNLYCSKLGKIGIDFSIPEMCIETLFRPLDDCKVGSISICLDLCK